MKTTEEQLKSDDMEYKTKIAKIKVYLDKNNSGLEVSEKELTNLQSTVIGMAPKIVGTFLEKILRRFYNIDSNGHVNSTSDGIHQTEDIEIKSSRAIHTKKDGFETQYDYLLGYERRLLSVEELSSLSFDCNMQQVKPNLFDKIYYGILTSEGFLVFKMNKNVLLNDVNIAYCDKQHRGNVGEGQFHIKKSNIKHHVLNYYEGTISWKEIFNILKDIKFKNNKEK